MKNEPKYHHGDLRRALIDRALLAIEQAGLDAVSIRSISREIGVTHKAAAAHFRDKSDLLAAALTQGYERLSARLSAALEEGPGSGASNTPTLGVSALSRVAGAYGTFARESAGLFLAMAGARLNMGGQFVELEEAVHSAFAHVIDAARKDGHANPEGSALHFWACMQGVLVQCSLGRIRVAPDQWDEFVALTARRLIHGLQSS